MEQILMSGVTKRFSRRGAGSLGEQRNPLRARKASGWFFALDNVSLEIPAGKRLGIIGDNGSGKTTLLRIIAGVTQPTSGILAVQGRVVPLLELGAGMHPDLTGRENIYLNGIILGMRRQEVRRKFDSIVELAGGGDFLDMSLKHYSLGMTMRLGFSVAIHVDAEILLVDEAWGIGDAKFQAKSFEQLRKMQDQGMTTLLVSHDLGVIRRLTTEALWMRSGQVAGTGTTDSVIEAYQKQVVSS